jgi:hypothetical protein
VKHPTSLNDEDIKDEIIIKNMYIDEILSKFRNTLINEKVVIVIGYSFIDDPINNAFSDRIRLCNTGFKIVLVDPITDMIIESMNDMLRPLVPAVRVEFGSQNSFDSIVSAIQDRHPGEVIQYEKLVTQLKLFAILRHSLASSFLPILR